MKFIVIQGTAWVVPVLGTTIVIILRLEGV
jgi:hypothetical protein